MSFMQLEACYMCAYVVETNDGTYVVPADIFRTDLSLYLEDDKEEVLEEFIPYVEGDPESFEKVEGWFVRYSAPGFTDCTDYTGPHTSEEEAIKACKEIYGEEEQ